MQGRKLAGDNWSLHRQLMNKRKFDLEKSIDFANLPWLKGLMVKRFFFFSFFEKMAQIHAQSDHLGP